MTRLASEIVFRKIAAVLALLSCLIFLANCGKDQCYIPYPAEPRPGPPPSAAAPSAQPKTTPRVAEKSLTNLAAPRTIYHEVGPLETVWRISKMYDVTPESIYAANGLKPGDALKNGQRLTIPNAKSLRHIIPLYPNGQWRYIIVHHTATDIGNAKAIDRSHGERGFWNGLGYHFLIDNGTLGKGDGQIEVAPRWIRQQEGAHCKAGGMNDKAIGVSLVGNFNEECPTPNQMQSLGYLLKTLCDYYKIPYGNVRGHREVEGAATECPGKKFPVIRVRQGLSKY
jgi:N-acetylmuramoyl-L-alanine amidase